MTFPDTVPWQIFLSVRLKKPGKHLNVHDALFDLQAPFVVLKVDMAMVDPFLLAQLFFAIRHAQVRMSLIIFSQSYFNMHQIFFV